jgi:hypothetical protein
VSRSSRKLVFPLVVASGFAVWFLVRDRSSAPTSGTSAGGATFAPSGSGSAEPSSYAFLDDLKVGDTIGEWTVSRMVINESVEKKPQLAIELDRKGSGITVWVARKANITTPPLSTDKYGLSYGHARLYGDPIPEDAYTKCMNEIAARIRRREATEQPPPGL